jgi:hypothetical protein
MTLIQTIRLWIDLLTRFVSPPVVAAEWIIAALAVLLISRSPAKPWPSPEGDLEWLDRLRGRFTALAAHKTRAILICGCLPIVVRLALLGILPVPGPSIHDEFSHLLLADTLAHGRLSNPVHPMWQHFESIHIIQQPAYSSMYPPGQGVFLALGQTLFHVPWAGVLISVGLMFAAICWMMQQWMPPSFAFYGTLLAIFKIGILGPWIDSYLGGPVSALGGALVVGAAMPLREAPPKVGHALLFALGLVFLMNSRPFEGAFLGVMALVWIVSGCIARPVNVAIFAPAVALLIAGFVFTGYYSWRVTGSPVRMPYMVNRDTYGWPENLAFLPVRVVQARHKVLRDMYAMEVQRRDHLKSLNAFVADIGIRVFENWAFFIGPLLTLPLLAALVNFRSRAILPLGAFLCAIAVLNLFQLVLYPYHLGPVVPVMFALVALGTRRIYDWLSHWRAAAGPVLALLLPLCLLASGSIKQNAGKLQLPLTYWENSTEPHGKIRAAMERWLSLRNGGQLVLVRYSPTHSPNQEWVYNTADIDRSKVVWAREMDQRSDSRLLDYFKDREVWLLRADLTPPHLVHYNMKPITDKNRIDTTFSSPCACECSR